MNVEQYLNQLKGDYDSCQLPSADDAYTQRTLFKIAQAIIDGEYSMAEFRSYVDGWLRQQPFHDICISTVLDYIIDNSCRR